MESKMKRMAKQIEHGIYILKETQRRQREQHDQQKGQQQHRDHQSPHDQQRHQHHHQRHHQHFDPRYHDAITLRTIGYTHEQHDTITIVKRSTTQYDFGIDNQHQNTRQHTTIQQQPQPSPTAAAGIQYQADDAGPTTGLGSSLLPVGYTLPAVGPTPEPPQRRAAAGALAATQQHQHQQQQQQQREQGQQRQRQQQYQIQRTEEDPWLCNDPWNQRRHDDHSNIHLQCVNGQAPSAIEPATTHDKGNAMSEPTKDRRITDRKNVPKPTVFDGRKEDFFQWSREILRYATVNLRDARKLMDWSE